MTGTVSEAPLLLMQEGETPGRRWAIDRSVITIGRSEDCDVIIPDRQVSRHHATIHRQDDAWVLTDLGSKNGTFLNGQPVLQPVQLQDGDEIQVALCCRLLFVDTEATAPLIFAEGRRAGLELDKARRAVRIHGRELSPPLSVAQYRLLELLVDAGGRVIGREEIVHTVWPDAMEEGVSEQAIDALVRRLRERLAELDPSHEYIVTVRGHGFRLNNIVRY